MTRRFFLKILLVAVVVFSFLAFSGVLFAQGRSEEALERAIAAQEKHTLNLMARDGVEGTAVGLDENDQFVVKVFTARPGVAGIPASLDKVPVQVEVTGKFVARADPTARFPRAVPIGISTGHPNITAGTIGCRVTDDTNVYALSNNHVYANSNEASIGDSALQPGPSDGGTDPADKIGELYDFEPIQFARGRRIPLNYIDAAIAISSTSDLGNSTPEDGYLIPNSTTLAVDELYYGMSVQKYGRTTGLRSGSIDSTNAIVDVSYGPGKTARFVEQIVITPGSFSAGGDSGSLIVTNDEYCYPVGLLYAGSDTHTIANPIDLVLDRFNVTIDDGSGGGTTNNPPTASFTADPTSGVAPLTVDFDASGSNDSDGNIVSYAWDFGDGSTGSGMTTSHNYAAAGTYTVMLTVTDNDGAIDTDNQNITVSNGGGGSETMHVSDIYMWYSTAGRNYFIYTEVTILDESDSPVPDATVDLTTTLPNGSTGSGSGVTGSDGTVTFKIKSQRTGEYKSTVTNVTHASLTYEAGDNIVTEWILNVP